jgi:hypothetical protein
MKKLNMLQIIGGAALLTAAPFSLQWSQKNVALSLDSAEARIGRPLTATSVAGVSRRVHRRAYRRAVYGTAAVGLGGYGYYRYSSPAYSSYSAPYSYSSYSAPYSYSSYSAPYSYSSYSTPYSYYAPYYRRPYFGFGLFY